jgi:hypothetical protein
MIVKDSKEHRSALGKLLAREDITINHGNYKTAFFDVKNRVLGLPDWSDKNKSVYDMLLGHEVGHALYTPLEELEFVKGMPHFDVINIVEDVRIERMIQKTYPGLPRYFKEGYTELWDAGFFGVDEDKITDLNFLDRLNLHAKVGKIVDVPLNDEELELYNECYAAETFEDVMKIYQKIVDRLEKEKEEKEGKQEEFEHNEPNVPDNNEDETPPMGGGADDNDITDEDFNEALEELENESKDLSGHDDDFKDDGTEAEEDGSKNVPSNGNEAPEEPIEDLKEDFKSDTQRKFDETLEQEQFDKLEANPYADINAMIPSKKSLNKVLVNYKDLDEERKAVLINADSSFEKIWNEPIESWNSETYTYDNLDPSEVFLTFKKETSKKVATLVREFERKKSAYQYSRAQVSRSGKLDVNRIHSYKYDDNIFASVTNLADAKSHGMIFFVDYSGSMHGTIGAVLKQTLLLTEFCDKVGIPYEVYSFTDCGYWGNESDFGFQDEVSLEGVRITNPLSSKMKKKEKIYFRKYLWLIAEHFSCGEHNPWFRSESEKFGGTPLNSSLLASVHLIDKFRAENPIQKLMLITLSDGDSHGICLNKRYIDSGLSFKIGNKRVSIPRHNRTQTEHIVKALGKVKDVTTIGFFIPNSKSDVNYRLGSSFGYVEKREFSKKYNKQKHLELKDFNGYDSYFFMDCNPKMITEEEFNPEITDRAGKSMADSASSQKKLAREFAKNKSSSRNSRILLEKFAEMVA